MRDEPDRDLGHLLLHAARGLRRGWAAALEPLDLPPHLARALVVLGRKDAPPRLGVVAEHLRITPRAATEVVDALEERGLAQRTPDAADRRATCVMLTEAGRTLLTQVDKLRRADHQRYFSVLTDAERADLVRVLRRLDDAHPRP